MASIMLFKLEVNDGVVPGSANVLKKFIKVKEDLTERYTMTSKALN